MSEQLDISKLGPSTPLEVWEIRGMINRLRRASIAVSIGDDTTWLPISRAIANLNMIHEHLTGMPY